MQASLRLVVTGLVFSLLSFGGGTLRAIAQTTDPSCYMEDRSGRTVNLSYLCGAAPPEGRVPSAASRIADCKQLEQIFSPAARETMDILKTIESQNALQQAGKMTGVVDRFLPQFAALQLSNPNLITLRSQYVRDLKEANAVLKRMINARKSGNTQAATHLLPSLQTLSIRAGQVGTEIDRYCSLTK